MTNRAQTPHGELLDRARAALGISQREAARRAHISEGRWRQIVTGVQRQGGVSLTVHPKPSTLMAMAHAVEMDAYAVLDAAGIPEADWPRPSTPTGDSKTDALVELKRQVDEMRRYLDEVIREDEHRSDERA